eukprot:9540994-Lingulodinium_polyedra.AAC.1
MEQSRAEQGLRRPDRQGQQGELACGARPGQRGRRCQPRQWTGATACWRARRERLRRARRVPQA